MSQPISLTAQEAACLDALRAGTERKALIALRSDLSLRKTLMALRTLAAFNLASIGQRHTWRLTPEGKKANISIAPVARARDGRPKAKPVPGAAASRLLALLDRPRHGAELRSLLGVTRQRIHQLVVELSGFDLIRFADPKYPTFVVALKGDPSILLRSDQGRVLSALPETEATTLSKLAAVLHMSSGRLAPIAGSLREMGLIERTGTSTRGELYRLTEAGSTHWQRSVTAQRAATPPLPFRSDRVRAVLSCLESRGPIRTRDVGLGLGISQTSINALMQYLKRRNTVRTHTDERWAPYELTPDGRRMLMAMRCQASAAAAI